MLLLGNVGGRQEIRNTQRRWLTGMHAPFYEVEGTRIIFPKESKLGVGGNAGSSEIQHLNRPTSCGPIGRALKAGGRQRVK